MAQLPLIALIGRPNVGKSSLFNRLSGRRQAITHEVAGTTRDPNYAAIEWSGRSMMLIDTAGLSKAEDEIELAVQDQVRDVASVADIMVVVIDAGIMLTNEDQQAARMALKTGKPVILAVNKIDTAQKGLADDNIRRLGVSDERTITTSAIHGDGTGDLLDLILDTLGPAPEAPEGARDEDAPIKLALLGRPNVGKSSLLNSLVGKQQAVVSGVAGTTRDVARATVRYHQRPIEILDTAGLRRRGKIEQGVEKFSSLRTLGAIREADICAVVIDATDWSVAGDQHMAGMVTDAGKGLILVVNKWDAVEDKDDRTMNRFMRKLQSDFAFAAWAPVVFVSATQGLNVTKLFELTQEIDERRHTEIATGPLNKLIASLVSKQPPAGLKSKRPKLNYATQTGTNPPVFTMFSSFPELVHFSYRRYLENGLRAAYDFAGTPIQVEFRGKREEWHK